MSSLLRSVKKRKKSRVLGEFEVLSRRNTRDWNWTRRWR